MPKRIHPKTRVGDRFGLLEVIAILPRDRTSNEKVLLQCQGERADGSRCGFERASFTHNARRHPLHECLHTEGEIARSKAQHLARLAAPTDERPRPRITWTRDKDGNLHRHAEPRP